MGRVLNREWQNHRVQIQRFEGLPLSHWMIIPFTVRTVDKFVEGRETYSNMPPENLKEIVHSWVVC